MTDIAQEISDDYYIDDEPNHPDPLDVLDEETIECDSMDQELSQLIEATMAIESYGMTPTSYGVMKAYDFLSGTSIDALAMESFNHDGPDSFESLMAIESLTDKIKEKVAAWSAKILGFIKSSGEKVLGVLGSLKDKIFAQATALISKAWDATKSAGRTIKAHPFKSIMAALATAAIVAAIVSLAVAPGTYATTDSIRAFMFKMRDMVKNFSPPFNKIKVDVIDTETVKRITYHVDNGVGAEVAEFTTKTARTVELGWTQSAVKAATAQLNRVWSTVKTGVSSMAAPMINGVKKFDAIGADMKDLVGSKVTEKTGSKIAGWAANKWVEKMYMTALWSVVGVITKLLKDVVVKAFRMVSETFNALKPEVQPA